METKVKKKQRRLSDRLRSLADKSWSRGSRDIAEDLHEAARRAEQERREYAEKD